MEVLGDQGLVCIIAVTCPVPSIVPNYGRCLVNICGHTHKIKNNIMDEFCMTSSRRNQTQKTESYIFHL